MPSEADVPIKTAWLHCCNAGANMSYAVQGVPEGADGAHLGADNYLFLDGHAHTYAVEPIQEHYLILNQHAFHYPPEVPPSQVEWWVYSSLPDDKAR